MSGNLNLETTAAAAARWKSSRFKPDKISFSSRKLQCKLKHTQLRYIYSRMRIGKQWPELFLQALEMFGEAGKENLAPRACVADWKAGNERPATVSSTFCGLLTAQHTRTIKLFHFFAKLTNSLTVTYERPDLDPGHPDHPDPDYKECSKLWCQCSCFVKNAVFGKQFWFPSVKGGGDAPQIRSKGISTVSVQPVLQESPARQMLAGCRWTQQNPFELS